MTDQNAPDAAGAPLQVHLELRVRDTRILCLSHVPQDEWDARTPEERLTEVRKGVLEGVESILRQVEQKDLLA